MIFSFYTLFFLSMIVLGSSHNVYVDATSPCTIDCGQASNPFKSLPLAMYVIDQIIDENPDFLSTYASMSSQYNASDSIHFLLNSSYTYDFNWQELYDMRPCDTVHSECLFPFLYHQNNTKFSGDFYFETNNVLENAKIRIFTQRAVIYTNQSLHFIQITFLGFLNSQYDNDNIGLTQSHYSFIMIIPFANDPHKNSVQVEFTYCGFSSMYYDGGTIGLNHSYSHFLEITKIDSIFSFSVDLSQYTISRLHPSIIFEQCTFKNLNELFYLSLFNIVESNVTIHNCYFGGTVQTYSLNYLFKISENSSINFELNNIVSFTYLVESSNSLIIMKNSSISSSFELFKFTSGNLIQIESCFFNMQYSDSSLIHLISLNKLILLNCYIEAFNYDKGFLFNISDSNEINATGLNISRSIYTPIFFFKSNNVLRIENIEIYDHLYYYYYYYISQRTNMFLLSSGSSNEFLIRSLNYQLDNYDSYYELSKFFLIICLNDCS